jgi:hypothetical protein
MRAIDICWALAAIVPLSGLGFLAAAALERAGVSATVRERVWSLAYWLGPMAGALDLAGHALPGPVTAEITVVLRNVPLGVLSRAARTLGQTPHIYAPRLPELLLGAIALGAACRLALLARGWLALGVLRREATDAPGETVQAARGAGLHPSVPVRLSERAATPMAAGLFKPEVLLPPRFAAPEMATLVCRHEAQHLRRRDNLRLLAERLADALFWIDPLRAALHRRLLAAREERCDAAALVGCTPAERALYARTLLDELAGPTAPALAVGLIGQGRSHAMTRISAVLDPQPTRRRPALTLGLCALLAGAGGGTAYAASQADQPAPNWVNTVVARTVALGLAQPGAAEPIDVAPAAEPDMASGMRPARSRLTKPAGEAFALAQAAARPQSAASANSGASAPVAAQPDGANWDAGDNGVSTIFRSRDTDGPVDITADRMQKDDVTRTVRYLGHVDIIGGTKSQLPLLIDGRPAPADFIPSAKPDDRFVGIEIKFGPGKDGGFGKIEDVNYLTHE